jgi:hypothetical protein
MTTQVPQLEKEWTRQQKLHLLEYTMYVMIVWNLEAHSAYWTALTCTKASGHIVTIEASNRIMRQPNMGPARLILYNDPPYDYMYNGSPAGAMLRNCTTETKPRKVCPKDQQRQVSNNGATSPNEHRRRANADE